MGTGLAVEPGGRHAICDAMRCAEWEETSGRNKSGTAKRGIKKKSALSVWRFVLVFFFTRLHNMALSAPYPPTSPSAQHHHPFAPWCNQPNTLGVFFDLVSLNYFYKATIVHRLQCVWVWPDVNKNWRVFSCLSFSLMLSLCPFPCVFFCYQRTQWHDEE